MINPGRTARHVLADGQEIRFGDRGDELELSAPRSYFDLTALRAALDGLGEDPESRAAAFSSSVTAEEPGRLTLRLSAAGGELDRLTAKLAARWHGHPDYGHLDSAAFRNATDPVLSCVILLTANDEFVARHLIPSIIANSTTVPIEIIVVVNGSAVPVERFADVRVVSSEFGWVSRGYNTGARIATGEFVAFFHDDCTIDDPDWIDRSIAMLRAGRSAVTPEIQKSPVAGEGTLITAKAVPLVLTRERFLAAGGIDENYYAGIEDLDFTYGLIAAGAGPGRLPVAYRHHNGMSTVTMLSGSAAMFRRLFGLDLVPQRLIDDLRTQSLERVAGRPEIALMRARDQLYFLDKYRDHFSASGRTDVLRLEARLRERLAGFPTELRTNPILTDQRLFAEHYRQLVEALDDSGSGSA